MGAQRLGAKRLRMIGRETGQDVRRGWSHGGYVLGFVTPDHRHGWFDLKTREWGWDNDPAHYTFCREWDAGNDESARSLPGEGSERADRGAGQ